CERDIPSAPLGPGLTAIPGARSARQSGKGSARFSLDVTGGTGVDRYWPDVTSGPPDRGVLENYGLSRRPALAQRSLMAGQVARLEGRLFDEAGQLRPGLSGQAAGVLLSEINDLRHGLGWLGLDLQHH